MEDSRKRVIKQSIVDYRNPQGAWALIRESGWTPREIRGFIEEILKEAEEKKILHRKQFDIKTMRYLTLQEWIIEYFKE